MAQSGLTTVKTDPPAADPTRVSKFLSITATIALGLTLTACSPGSDISADHPTSKPAAAAPVETAAPVVETPAAPVADEFSQVINGTLIQGTPEAPVRIGTDTPGQAPAAEAGFVAGPGGGDYVVANNKYAVSVSPTEGGYKWKVFGMSEHGSYRDLAHGGYNETEPYPSAQAALDAPKVVDGRTLDRAEYILIVVNR